MKNIIHTIMILAFGAVSLFAQEYRITPPQEDEVVVGAIGGIVDITALGGASYSIPLQIPDGIDGMQPNLSIVYNSQGGNGLLGWGWDLGGLSSIQREGQTLYHDGLTGTLELNDNDRFTLDGKRLMAVGNTTYGANLAEYKTEVDGMSKVVSYTGHGFDGPIWFKVWTEDGRIMEYGNAENARVVRVDGSGRKTVVIWLLNRVENREGNYVVYNYEVNNHDYRLNDIQYSGHPGAKTTIYGISFHYYNNRVDRESEAVGDYVLYHPWLLKDISIYHWSQPLSKYEFGYDTNCGQIDTRFYYNRLTEISYNYEGVDLNPTMIDWGTDPTPIANPNYSNCQDFYLTGVNYNDPNETFNNNVKFSGDFNGDGFSDVIIVGSSSSDQQQEITDTILSRSVTRQMRVYLNRGHNKTDNNAGVSNFIRAEFDMDEQHTDFLELVDVDWVYVCDFNGDGLDDIVTIGSSLTLWGKKITVRGYKSVLFQSEWGLERVRFDDTQSLFWNHTIGSSEHAALLTGDFYGRKRDDLIVANSSSAYSRFYYFTYDDASDCILSSESSVDWKATMYTTCDYDGDGKTEVWFADNGQEGRLVKLYIDQNQAYTYYEVRRCFDSNCKLFIGDFNGDGRSDFLAYHSDIQDEGWEVVYGGTANSDFTFNVSSIFNNYQIDDPGDYGYDFRTRETLTSMKYYLGVFDVDGDGKTDIVVRDHDETVNGHTYVFYGPLRKTSGVAHFANVEEYYTAHIGFNGEYTYGICAGNFLGQENTSILQNGYLLSSPQLSICYNVQTVTDGMGSLTRFDYDYLVHNPMKAQSGHDDNIYTISDIGNNLGGYYIYNTPLSIKAVGRITSHNVFLPTAPFVVNNCSYHNAMFHKMGKGFLGFEKVTQDNWLELRNSAKKREAAKHQYKTVSTYSHKPMGEHCMVLPEKEETFRYRNTSDNPGVFEEVAVSETIYGYQKFLCQRDNNSPAFKVFVPVPCSVVTNYFEPLGRRTLLKRKITETEYNGQTGISPLLYNNAVRPTKIRQGTDAGQMSCVADCEFQDLFSANYLLDLTDSWILNRPQYVITQKSRRTAGFSDTKLLVKYEYNSQKPYLPERVFTYPSGYKSQSDKLATRIEYLYRDGRVMEETLTSINDTLQARLTCYGYDTYYRFRTSEAKPYGYVTSCHYDEIHGTLDYVTDLNNYRKVTRNDDHLGITVRTFETDNDENATKINGTESVTALRWIEDSDYEQFAQGLAGAAYFLWKKSEGSAETVTIYDATGRELRTVSHGLRENGSEIVYKDTQYDDWGRLLGTSNPYYSDASSGEVKWTFYKYDDFDRIDTIYYPPYMLDEELVEPYTDMDYDGLMTTSETGAIIGERKESHTLETMANVMGWTDYNKEYLDPGLETWNTITYEYNADGSLSSTMVNEDETSKISIIYDNAGNKRELHDPDYGITYTWFNAFGQLQRQQTPKADIILYRYDKLGRLVIREETDNNNGTPTTETTTWTFNNTEGIKGLPKSISLDNRQEISYTYDPLYYNNLLEVSEDRNGTEYSTSYLYSDGNFPQRVSSVTYPSGYTIEKSYDAVTGDLTEIRHNNQLLWETLDANAMGQITHFATGNGVDSYYLYDDCHQLSAQQASNNSSIIQDFGYEYDIFGNLAARTENKLNMPLTESFIYDHLNRLKTVTLNEVVSAMEFDPQGRIIFKETDGQTVFTDAQYQTYDQGGNLKPHAISSASVANNPFPCPSTQITYTMFDKVKTLNQYNDNNTLVGNAVFTYGFDHERISLKKGADYEKQYWGNCELINSNGTSLWNTFISGPIGVFAAVTTSNNSETLRYIYKDHLGSWTTITNDAGSVEQELSFDAWGNLRNAGSWSGLYNGSLLYDRGFTGHEHLFEFNLINMNGRMYDPVMSSFLSVDNYVQSPESSQSFNRYAYCLNNPLRYTDPNGEFFIIDSWLSGYLQGYYSVKEDNKLAGLKKAHVFAVNDIMIWKGLFQTDSNKDFLGRTWELVSRFTWQLPQTVVGFGFTQISNLGGQVDKVDYYGGATVSSGNFFGRSGEAVTLGSFINGSSSLSADPNNSLFQHEFGHYLQSQEMGFAYLNRVGIPSLLSTGNHKYHPVEMDANRRAFLYFNKHVEGFYKTKDDMYYNYGWNFDENPLKVHNSDEDSKYIDFYNSSSLELLNNLTVHAKWYDYVCWRKYKYGPLIIGLYNALLYNYQNH